MTLLLTTPEQHRFNDPTLELNEKKLQRWLASLPVLNAGESLRQVLNALEPLNEQQLDVGKRLALLLHYQATFQRLYAAAEPLRLRQQPLSQQQRRDTVDDVERLSLSMANGFKLVVKQLHAQGNARDPVQFARVLRWTLQQLAAALLHSYRFHRPEPGFVFLELNQIYRLARHLGVHDKSEDVEQDGGRHSLATVYQAICLLSLCDSYSLEEGLADSYYRCLLRYADAGRIVPGNTWQGVPEGLYYIDLKGDSRPRHCVFLESPVDGDDPHLLDARSTLQHMHKALAALPADRRRTRTEAGILRALLPEVTSRDKRSDVRRRDGRWVGLVTGMAGTVEYLSALQRGAPQQTVQMRVKDASERGYCLVWDESAASVLQVGDLVGVVSDSGEQAPQRLQLMVVRWLRDLREQGTELGVELIDGVASPVGLINTENASRQLQPALFMSSTGGRDSKARLLAPVQVYAENRPLLLLVGEREVAIRCGLLVEQTSTYDCFEFTGAP